MPMQKITLIHLFHLNMWFSYASRNLLIHSIYNHTFMTTFHEWIFLFEEKILFSRYLDFVFDESINNKICDVIIDINQYYNTFNCFFRKIGII